MASSKKKVGSALIADLLRAGYRVRFRAMGRSMIPTIGPGQNIAAEPVVARDLCVGDVVVYSAGPRILVHRLVAVGVGKDGQASFVMRGDNLHHDDHAVGAAAILGRAVEVEGLAGTVSLRR